MTGRELMALAQKVAADWQNDPNVIGVGFGVKERGGRIVRGPSLLFTVRQKFANEHEIRAAGSRPIPHEIEGVMTDVSVVNERPAVFERIPEGNRGTHIENPLKGGTSTAPLCPTYPFPVTYGTLACVCFHQDGRLMALSNAHVWGADHGCEIIQPFLPVTEFLQGIVKVLTCGPLAFLFDWEQPSLTTSLLATGATMAWMAACALDVKDPNRRGEENTFPGPGELTLSERVEFSAEPKDLPLPGTPYRAAVSWTFTRQTNSSTHQYGVNEVNRNEHILVHKELWTNKIEFPAGDVIEIMAAVEAEGVSRADAFHVVVHLRPSKHPERTVSRVLHPAGCKLVPFKCVNFSHHAPDSEAEFPFDQQGLLFKAAESGKFRDAWPPEAPDGHAELQFPDSGVEIDIPLSTRAEVHVVTTEHSPVKFEGYRPDGTLVASTATEHAEGIDQVLVVSGDKMNRLILRGGRGEALLLYVCLRLSESIGPAPMHPKNNIFCYRGRYTLDPGEQPDAWSGVLSVQTVNIVPPGVPPEIAAQTIGAIESAGVALQAAGCAIVLALDKLFDVI